MRGLSPRVRGNHRLHHPLDGRQRSIPARAGEPELPIDSCHWEGVYPRACGGTFITRVSGLSAMGLSPRVRGNRTRGFRQAAPPGSIPARAGEPDQRWRRRPLRRVYPRACGGTIGCSSDTAMRPGLSPRVRGNRRWALKLPRRVGSIPARAGEPLRPLPMCPLPTVYPRACGGTGRPLEHPRYRTGLSPRVRGNRFVDCPYRNGDGSIPARAGEPARRYRWCPMPRVYPRACGGTGGSISPSPPINGLSPRVRGNRGPRQQ